MILISRYWPKKWRERGFNLILQAQVNGMYPPILDRSFLQILYTVVIFSHWKPQKVDVLPSSTVSPGGEICCSENHQWAVQVCRKGGELSLSSTATFSNSSNSSDSIVKVKVKGPKMCYIFGKHGIQGYQIWHSRVSNVKYTNTQIRKYTNTKGSKDPTYFWKAWDSRISNMIFQCVKCKIHNYKNTK